MIALASFGMACLLWAVATAAQPPSEHDSGLLDQTRRRNEVAAQKTEVEVRGALREAQRLNSSEPDRAVVLLKRALAQLEADTSLPAERRQTLKRMLQDRVRVTETGPEEVAGQVQSHGGTQADKRRGEGEESVTDLMRIERLREEVRKWQKENGPAAQAGNRTSAVNKQLADNRQLQLERERRTSGALRDVDKTALPPKGDVEFPRDWKARTQDRKNMNEVPLTAKERAILRALDSTISVRFKNSPFESVIEYLQTTTGQPILLNRSALEAKEVTYETPVTVEVKGVTLRFLLRKVLNDLGLAYVIKGEAIQVVTAEQAREMTTTRVQYVGDLISALTRAARVLQAAQLIDLIQNTIDPSVWQVNGGPGTIIYNDLTRSLVIKAPAEVQPVLSNGLR
jgi:hypothetical protein